MKYNDKKSNLEIMASKTPNIYKWIGNVDIDEEFSNGF